MARSRAAQFGEHRVMVGRQVFVVSKARLLGLFVLLYTFVHGYLELPLVASGLEVPAIYLVVALPILVLVQRAAFRKSDLTLFVSLAVILALSVFLVPNWDDVFSRIKGFLQFLFSLLLFLVVYRSASALGRLSLARIFTGVAIFLVLVTVLERFTPLGQLSDAFRRAVYVGGYTVYEGDVRDLNLVGYVRPKGFTSEPSLLGLGFCVAAASAMMLVDSLRSRLLLALLVIFEWAVAGTPIALLSLSVLAIDMARNMLKKRSLLYLVGALLVASVLTVASLLGLARLGTVGERFEVGRFAPAGVITERANESSERLRLVYPYISATDAIGANPVLGLGVGGKRSLSIYSSLTSDYEIAVGNNAFATIFIFFGIVGSGCLLAVLIRYFKGQGADLYVLLPILFLVMNSLGGLETPRLWVYIGVLLAAAVASRTSFRMSTVDGRIGAL